MQDVSHFFLPLLTSLPDAQNEASASSPRHSSRALQTALPHSSLTLEPGEWVGLGQVADFTQAKWVWTVFPHHNPVEHAGTCHSLKLCVREEDRTLEVFSLVHVMKGLCCVHSFSRSCFLRISGEIPTIGLLMCTSGFMQGPTHNYCWVWHCHCENPVDQASQQKGKVCVWTRLCWLLYLGTVFRLFTK